MYPDMKKRIRAAEDPLKEALRIAVAGNFIDFGTTEQVDLKAGLEEILDQELAIDHYGELRGRLEKAGEVLMLGDNAGETVFDRILIEELGKPVRYVVREAPMILFRLCGTGHHPGILFCRVLADPAGGRADHREGPRQFRRAER
jgi:uncharacterized protein with ATP-grasp and redox domains